MRSTRRQKRISPRARRLDGTEGVDFVRCRICGDRRRVISGRHLSKHDTDRETYIEEYDLSPDELVAKDFRRIQSSRRGYRPYGKREWLAAIRAIHNRGGSVLAGDLQDTHPHIYQQGVWIFGGWDNALRAAGFDPEVARKRTFWDAKRIAAALNRMRKQGLPMYTAYAMKNRMALYSAARNHFGSWNKALLTLGIVESAVPRKTRLGLLRDLRDALESGTAISARLRLHLEYYFGRLRNAKLALKTHPRLLSGWSERKILAMIVQEHRLKESLAYGRARREFPALLSAAEAYFGSWGKALHAAGIDPNLYFVHHRWCEPKAKT
jgi:hypothetical protein